MFKIFEVLFELLNFELCQHGQTSYSEEEDEVEIDIKVEAEVEAND
jgi:hypothetical protein